MASREGARIWFWLGFWKNYGGTGKWKWRFPEFVRRQIWKSEYFWQDNIFTYWNRFLGCKLRGHRKVRKVERGNDVEVNLCFNCYREIDN